MPAILIAAGVLAAGSLSIPEADAHYIRRLSAGTEGSGPLVVELLVAPDHTVEGCKVLLPASEVVEKRICNQASRGKVPIVAMDVNGVPIHGFVTVSRVPVSSMRSFQLGMLAPADLQVEVLDIPGRETRKVVYVTVLVDSSGSVVRCQKGDGQKQDLASVACEQARHYRQAVVHDRTGAAVPYVKALTVEFVEQPPKCAD